MKLWYRWHRWLAGIGGAALIMWLLTGLVLSLNIGDDPVAPEPVKLVELPQAPAALANAAGGELVAVQRIAGRAAYEIRTGSGRVMLIDASTGAPISIDARVAAALVSAQYPGSRTGAPELLHAHDLLYRSGRLPVWRISAAGGDAIYHVQTANGSVQRLTRWSVVQSVMGKLHDFSLLHYAGLSAGPVLILVHASILLVLAATGTGYLLLLRRRRA